MLQVPNLSIINSSQSAPPKSLKIFVATLVEVSLGEKSNTQHRYQISKGQDGEVNIDVVVGDQPADDE